MKLYIKQKVLTAGDRFDIKNENGNPIFTAASELFSLPPRFRIFDMKNNEVLTIQKKLAFPLAQYDIIRDGRTIASVNEEFAVLSSRLSVTSDYGSFRIDGDIVSLNYTFYRDDKPFAGIHKAPVSIGDSYELDVYDDIDVELACALVIVIDNRHHSDD